MATYVPAKINTEFITYVGLPSQANTLTLQANPTLAAGDVKVATDDGAPANADTLPAVDGDFTKRVKVTLSASEMNGDNITVIFSDAAGDEWCDLIINIQTAAGQIDDIPTAVENRQEMDSNSTRLDADISSRAPSGEYNTEMGRITGNVALASGVDLTHIMGTILTEGGAGRLSAAFIKLLDVVTPLLVASDVMRGTDGANTTVPDAAGTAATLHGVTDGKVDTVDSNTQDIQGRIPAALSGGNMKADVLAISTSTNAADNLKASAETIILGTVGATDLTTTTCSTGISLTDAEQLNGRIIIFRSDTTTAGLRYQATDITGFVVANGVLTFTAITTAPSAGDTFIIV